MLVKVQLFCMSQFGDTQVVCHWTGCSKTRHGSGPGNTSRVPRHDSCEPPRQPKHVLGILKIAQLTRLK